MKKVLCAFVSLLAVIPVMAEDLSCNVSVNLEEVARVEFSVNAKEQYKYVSSEGYSFYMNNKGDGKFELEIFDGSVPSRSYAQGFLRSQSDTLTWTIWNRDIILATECKLVAKK